MCFGLCLYFMWPYFTVSVNLLFRWGGPETPYKADFLGVI